MDSTGTYYLYNLYRINVKFADCTIAVWPSRIAPWYHDPVFGSSVITIYPYLESGVPGQPWIMGRCCLFGGTKSKNLESDLQSIV